MGQLQTLKDKTQPVQRGQVHAGYTPALPRALVEERGEEGTACAPHLPDFRGSTLPTEKVRVLLAAPSLPRQARWVGASRYLIFLRFTSLRDRRPDRVCSELRPENTAQLVTASFTFPEWL